MSVNIKIINMNVVYTFEYVFEYLYNLTSIVIFKLISDISGGLRGKKGRANTKKGLFCPVFFF